VCSRNYDLTYAPDQTQWRLAMDLHLHDLMVETYQGERVALQGETLGEGIQGNPLKLKGTRFALFTIRVGSREVPRAEWPDWAFPFAVPEVTSLTFPVTVEEAVTSVDGLRSVYSDGHAAEGVVWRAVDVSRVTYVDEDGVERSERASFKVISRKYLLKNDR
jgi:RNA ligase (TIGR02306 family)